MANSLHNQRILALVFMVVVTVFNVYGVRVVALINNIGVIFHTSGTNATVGTFLIAMFMSLFVIYGFDTAATLAEETRNPRRDGPKAILYAIVGAFIIGGIFIWATLMAVPGSLASGVKGALGPAAVT